VCTRGSGQWCGSSARDRNVRPHRLHSK
jgi:hypothetical protein